MKKKEGGIRKMKNVATNVLENKNILIGLLTIGIVMCVSDMSWAVDPQSTNFAIDVYNIAVDKILKGPVGFVGGVIAIVFGAMMAIRAQVLPAISAIIGGGVLLGADKIVSSMGALVF